MRCMCLLCYAGADVGVPVELQVCHGSRELGRLGEVRGHQRVCCEEKQPKASDHSGHQNAILREQCHCLIYSINIPIM